MLLIWWNLIWERFPKWTEVWSHLRHCLFRALWTVCYWIYYDRLDLAKGIFRAEWGWLDSSIHYRLTLRFHLISLLICGHRASLHLLKDIHKLLPLQVGRLLEVGSGLVGVLCLLGRSILLHFKMSLHLIHFIAIIVSMFTFLPWCVIHSRCLCC